VIRSFRQLANFFEWRFLTDPEEDRRAQVLLGLPALERGGEFVGVPFSIRKLMHSVVNLPWLVLSSVKADVAVLDRVVSLRVEESGLELHRDLLGDGGKVADVRDPKDCVGSKRSRCEDLGEVVAHAGAVEAFGGVELVACPSPRRRGPERMRTVGLEVFLSAASSSSSARRMRRRASGGG